MVAGLAIALLDADGEFFLLVPRKQRSFVDLTEVRFQRRPNRTPARKAHSWHEVKLQEV